MPNIKINSLAEMNTATTMSESYARKAERLLRRRCNLLTNRDHDFKVSIRRSRRFNKSGPSWPPSALVSLPLSSKGCETFISHSHSHLLCLSSLYRPGGLAWGQYTPPFAIFMNSPVKLTHITPTQPNRRIRSEKVKLRRQFICCLQPTNWHDTKQVMHVQLTWREQREVWANSTALLSGTQLKRSGEEADVGIWVTLLVCLPGKID